MKTNTTPAPRPASHPPPAHDAQGNAQPIPDGAAFWLLKRETGGRPRIVVGPDRQPVRFALTTTVDDIETMLGAGTFRVYALTEVGETIDYVSTLVVGEDDDETDEPASRTVTGWPVANNNTDSLHHALQTITAMAKAQAEALCQVSEAQADFLKGLASAKASRSASTCGFKRIGTERPRRPHRLPHERTACPRPRRPSAPHPIRCR